MVQSEIEWLIFSRWDDRQYSGVQHRTLEVASNQVSDDNTAAVVLTALSFRVLDNDLTRRTGPEIARSWVLDECSRRRRR